MENFTPYSALAGGLLIGISAMLMLLFNGRVTGISGMLSGVLIPVKSEWLWRFLFLIGMVAGTVVFHFYFPDKFQARTDYPLFLLIPAGFLVGFGTRLGNGCTSGHAVCGIARFSKRSMVATGLFMFSAGVTVYILRHIMGVSA